MMNAKDNAVVKSDDVREDMKSQSHDGSLGSGLSIGGKFGDDATLTSGEVVIDQKVGETVSDTSSTKDSGKSVGKTIDESSHDGKDGFGAKRAKCSSLEQQTVSRLIASEIKTKSLSPGAEIKGPNKRAALICYFYAKGRCIKGSSCRFLHVKDRLKSDLPQQVGEAPTGLREGSLGSGSPSVRGPLAASVGNIGSNNFSEVPKFPQREELFPLSSFKEPGSEINKPNVFANEFRNPSSHCRSVEELARLQQQRPYDYKIQIPSDIPGSSSSIMLSSNGISARTGSLLPFSHVGSKPDSLPPMAKCKSSGNDWEPSVPFQPSILTRSMISLPESLNDPLHDSIELPKVGDASLKAFCSQGSLVVNTSNHQNNGEGVSENRGLACNDDTMSVSSHNTHHEKDLRTSEVEAVGTSTDWQNSKRKNSLGSSGVKDITETTSDARRRKPSSRAKAESIRQNNERNAGNVTEQSVNKESKAVRQFRAALIEFVKESLKPKWHEGHLSKDLHNKIVRKAVEKVLTTLPEDQVPTSMESVKQYLALSRSKIDKLVEGYTEIYGKA